MNKLGTGLLLARNLYKAFSLVAFPRVIERQISYRAFTGSDLEPLCTLFKQLNGIPLSSYQRLLLRAAGAKLCLTAHGSLDELIAIQLFYFNSRDLAERTIHEGFIGVHPEFERLGIATTMRRLSARHFLDQGYSGISSRISRSNDASLASANKVGFSVVEEHFDENAGNVECYLILRALLN